jgi:hypothetical protein
MILVQTQTAKDDKDDTASEKILRWTYVWINRLLWPVVCVISGFTTYWTFTLPAPDLLVKAGGGVFGVFSAVCFLNSVLWWCSDWKSAALAAPGRRPTPHSTP